MTDLSHLDKLILYTDCPSFGDYLMMNNLPELFYKKYGKYSYISDKCIFHNNETYDLIFGTNPFVKGKIDEYYNVLVDCRCPNFNVWQPKIYQERFGFFGENEIPKIYYKPKKLKKLKDNILFDIRARTYSGLVGNAVNRGNSLLNDIELTDKKIYVLEYEQDDPTINKSLPNKNYEVIKIKNLFEYCDVLNSVSYYIGINSGTALTAVSIKEYYNKNLNIYYITPPHNKVFMEEIGIHQLMMIKLE